MVEEILIVGMTMGGLYALIAAGLTLIFGVANIFNMAHGSFYMLSAYFTLFLLDYFDVLISTIFGIILTIVVGVITYILTIRPHQASATRVLLITFGLSIFFEQAILNIAGVYFQSLPSLIGGSIIVFGVTLVIQRLIILLVSVIVISFLWIFTVRTKAGKALRATAQNREASMLMGINCDRIFLMAIMLSAFLAATAGVLISPLKSLSPYMDAPPLTKAFAISTFGGLGSIKGSTVAAFIISFVEVIVGYNFSSYMKELVPLVVIVITILVRPSGLFGRPMR